MAELLNPDNVKTHMFLTTESYARVLESSGQEIAALRRENAELRRRLTDIEADVRLAQQYISRAMGQE